MRTPERAGGARRARHPGRGVDDDARRSPGRARARAASPPRGGRPILGTCAGMIVCDAEHLGFIDATARRNAFGRQLQSFEADLEVDRGIGEEPLRAVFIRAPWVEGPGRGGGPRDVGGSSGRDPRRQRPGLRLSSRADRRLALPRDIHGDDHQGARARREERGRQEDERHPKVKNLAKILVGYSTEVKEGEVVSIDGENAAAPLLLAVYEEVLKAGGNPILNVALDGRSPPTSSTPPTSSSNGSRRSPSGWSTTPTCGSRSAPPPTRASSPGCRRSARRCASRSPAT